MLWVIYQMETEQAGLRSIQQDREKHFLTKDLSGTDVSPWRLDGRPANAQIHPVSVGGESSGRQWQAQEIPRLVFQSRVTVSPPAHGDSFVVVQLDRRYIRISPLPYQPHTLKLSLNKILGFTTTVCKQQRSYQSSFLDSA